MVAQETVFGFVLSGQVPGNNKQCTSAQQLLVLNDFSEHEIRNLWELDYIGIMSELSSVMSDFKKTIQFKEGRYWVSLPWKKDGKTLLMDNLAEAREWLTKLNRKLDKDPKLKFDYERVFKEWEDMGIIEEVPSKEINWKKNPLFYLPHRQVIRESSESTKIRPVFDASAKAKTGVSLNDCLHAGPSLLPDLIEILIRLRRWKVALNADIQKAFLQICLQPEDKDVHRFLLFSNGTERIMRFTRVTFGVNCSPFLLNATIKSHLNQYPDTWVTDELKSNLYVDDLLSGADSVDDAHKLYNESKEIMYEAAMTLTKWQTNKKEILGKGVDENPHGPVKVLGVQWSPNIDCFQYDGVDLPENVFITKRLVLSFIARTFDPLGFMLPFTMSAKILFQQLWKIGLNWDDSIPMELEKQFKAWLEDISVLKQWRIPRKYTCEKWFQVRDMKLEVFCDASELAYGVVVYLKTSENNGQDEASPLVISKARVAPLKKLTVPRLELMGALLAVRLVDSS